MFFDSDLPTLIKFGGYAGLFSIIFAESGLFFGFFLPGDSLLFTVGILCSQGFFNIYVAIFLCFSAAVLGDGVGYAFGRFVGPKLFKKEDSFFFNKKHLLKAEAFYQKHGKKTIVLARFVPIIRTFAPILAGVAKMNYSVFFSYNIIGAILWAIGLPLAGYYMGSVIPNVDLYLLPIILGIILLSLLPIAIEIFRSFLRSKS